MALLMVMLQHVDVVGALLVFGGLLARFRHGNFRRAAGMMAWGCGVTVLSDVVSHYMFPACFNSAACAFCIWTWWNNGGGDDTKRKLRKFQAKFKGTRRTAPVLI